MASTTSPTSKRNSFHKLSNIFQLASPTFPRPSSDSQRTRPMRNKLTKTHDMPSVSVASLISDPRSHDNTLAPTASIISTANSALSMSQTPLLDPSPSSPAEDPVDLPVPPTTNELGADEKMKLIKTARKLSRVLGEVPVTSVTDEVSPLQSPKRLSDVLEYPSTPTSRSTSPLPSPSFQMQAVSASAKKAFRRSLTLVGSPSLQVPEMQRSKSISTLRPSLQIPSTPLDYEDHEAYSPIVFATDVDAPEQRVEDAADAKSISIPDVKTSQDPFVSEVPEAFPAESTEAEDLATKQRQEKIQRQRMAKLAHQLGDSIPPDVLRRAASPPPSRGNASLLYQLRDASHVLSMDSLPQRSSSLRAKTPRRKRPVSLDIKVPREHGIMTAPSSPLASPELPVLGTVRRAMSARPRTAGENRTGGDVSKNSEEITTTQEPGSAEPLTEKQRIINVKRAKKLTQLFGDNPPTALFQITNFGPLVDDDDVLNHKSFDGHRPNRDSIATIISLPSLYGDGHRLRDSFISVVTTSDVSAAKLSGESEVRPNIVTQISEEDVEPDEVETPKSAPVQTNKFLVSPPASASNSRRPKLTRSTSSPVSSRSTSPRPKTRMSLAAPSADNIPPRTPPTPPPFSNFVLSTGPWTNFVETTVETTIEPAELTTEDFHARRRRAAKLSKFFGVEVNTLVGHLPSDPSPSRPSRAGPPYSGLEIAAPQPVAIRGSSPFVSIAKTRGRFTDRDDVEDIDMYEVINKLRKMKS